MEPMYYEEILEVGMEAEEPMTITPVTNLQKIAKAVVIAVRAASTTATAQPQSIEVENPANTFYLRDLRIIRATPSQMKAKPTSWDNLKFGHVYSDHMMEVEWHRDKGWAKPLVSPWHNLSIHPGIKVLHYCIELYEGMKAYRGVDNKIRMFRPDKNMERMKKTAIRATLPDFDAEELIKIIIKMVKVDKEWVPYSNTSSLYIRPTMISTDPNLGIGIGSQAKLFVITTPVGAYYSTGFQPVALLADPEFVRVFPGGVGTFKMGCNYAPTIFIETMAREMGCQQALWLYDNDEKLTEVGTMNIFVYWINEQGEEELCTPPLTNGLILPGITRDSLLEIAREWNEFKITERYPTMEEIRRSLKEKRMLQMFGTGTACVVAPIGRILYKNKTTKKYENLYIPTMEAQPNLMMRYEGEFVIDRTL
uniref:Branched-chain-amino-acid aminotransferase n=1 Tax=Acrobeloides nanus TaxID=290746 RepID=A0A914D8C1_9BILA